MERYYSEEDAYKKEIILSVENCTNLYEILAEDKYQEAVDKVTDRMLELLKAIDEMFGMVN